MSTGDALILSVVLVWLLFTKVGRAFLVFAIIISGIIYLLAMTPPTAGVI